MTVSWANPLWLIPLLGLPPLYWWLARGRGPAVPLPSVDVAVLQRTRNARDLIPRLPLILRMIALAAILVALAGPRTAGGVVNDPHVGIPVVVAIDLSSSMLAQDFLPRNRLEVAKETVADFIDGRSGDPIGIVAFAGEAITVAPVTTFRSVVRSAVAALQVGLLEDGTAIGDGLAIAVNRLRDQPGRDRVIVLMSDGESNRGTIDAVDAARAAATFGIRVFTIGVGSDGVARVPVERSGSGLVYAEAEVGLDEALLSTIAEATGGRYFRATNAGALREIYREIDALVATPVENRRRVLFREWFLIPLLVAAGALAIEWLLRGSRWGAVPE